MSSFEKDLLSSLSGLKEQGLFRELREANSAQGPRLVCNGKELINFSSNDYLGLANDPELKKAAAEAIEEFGAGSGASRLICGSLTPHHTLEKELADFKRTEAALVFATGFAAALGVIGALMRPEDVVILDKLAHACIVDAARQSGAKLRVFAHNDCEDLEAKLRWAGTRADGQPGQRTLVVTESVFSMDGDRAPLADIVRLKDRYGAWLMLDEAHAMGVLGSEGRGLAEENGVSDRVEIQMGTLGKAAGAAGGFICGKQVLIDFLINRARSFIFSTAPVPAMSAAALAGIRKIRSEDGKRRREKLRALVEHFIKQSGVQHFAFSSAIVPLIVGPETKAVEISAELRSRGILIPAIRYPTVARGEARLRVTFTAAHTEADVESLLATVNTLGLQIVSRDSRLYLV